MVLTCARLRAGLPLAAVLAGFSATPALAHGDHGGGGDGTILPPGVTLVSFSYDTVSYKPFTDARLNALAAAGVEGVHSLSTISVPSLNIAYGVSNDFTMAARLPYLVNRGIRETNTALPGIDERGGVYGIGDASITGTYRFFNDHHSGVEAALLLGFKAPTGRRDAVDRSDELFEAEHQPGSGSWDFLFGSSLSKQVGLWSFGASTLYSRSGAGSQDTRLGDHANYGVSASYRLWSDGGGHDHAMHLGGAGDGIMYHGGVDHAAAATPAKTLDISLGVNGQWSGMQTIAGDRDGNTGGNTIFVTPGVRLTVDKWAIFGSVGVPAAQHLNGIQPEQRLQASTGVSVRF